MPCCEDCENCKLGLQIEEDYKNGMSYHQIVKKYDLYRESQFDGSWKKMSKKYIEYHYNISLCRKN